ncbi:Macrophage mannose receptor 1-like [Oopsacas minuta]|uniref:Macrophage mannose receptor 1-like n=1 Tax=Oopsacas minuta TaxID=111878 RepID=A0AAV7KCL2_9METZ|nr:Macrophage mannose receptor 1-like [Oopsacas minuta]
MASKNLYFIKYSSLNTIFRCYIGLNDILVDAGTDGSAFVWVDGNTSTYRNFGTSGATYPADTADYDCVSFRYKPGGAGPISNGWINHFCNILIDCHFCTKPATPNVCDLIYEGSCYRVFEVSTGINWLDAQSSCAVWGGDLTSIATQRENNYLYTIIMSNNCWIGLNDRSVEGTYTWSDDTTVSYANWTNLPTTAGNCIEINTDGGVSWETVNCEDNLNTFVCKRASTSTVTIVDRFGELTNERFDFQLLNSNTFLFTSLTLACGGVESNVIVWNFSEDSDLSNSVSMIATYSSTETGLSWLVVNITRQGYYQCQTSTSSYIIGLYDPSLTTVAVEEETYIYIVGVDSEDILLLCDPTEIGSLSAIMWDSVYNNPININNVSATLPTESRAFSCMRDTATIVMIYLSVTVPEISVFYGQFLAESFSSTYPSTNKIAIPLESIDISMFINLIGKWNIPGDMNSTDSTIDIAEFMEENAGLYTFYTDNNWNQEEAIVMQINITSAPPRPGLIPDEEFTYGGTSFGLISKSTGLDWLSAQLNCNNWGTRGNLVTIKSAVEDSLLLYSSTDINTYFGCWIGLNDIENDAGTNASAFVWVDGSSSTYRNFDSQIGINPGDGNSAWDCVRFRYRNGVGELSTDWINRGCGDMRNCYFCNQPAKPSECDLIYNGSCYRLFEVSDGINWLNAQSTCAVWGGDLTSITTERENNYLYTIIPDTVSNCWIGLNDRDGEGTYTWTDGSVYSHTNWTGSEPSNSNEDCVDIIRAGEAQTPNISLTYDDTTFGYFIAGPINWTNAELECNNWGGNLATIKSAKEDSLLFYSITDIYTAFSCYIGLNDIDVEAGTDTSEFVWVDGSNSIYRNFQSNFGKESPSGVADYDCVRFRYSNGPGILSTGWLNRRCSATRSCYFCSKPGDSQGCDLIYDGFCYRLFEVSTAINWLDAQSSCAVWSGDLTSITTERENNYLYTIIPDTVSNCWIGLNDRDNNDGTYTWIDDSTSTFTNWGGSTPNAGNADCVDIIRTGIGSWETVDCETTMINAFLCKRPSSITTVPEITIQIDNISVSKFTDVCPTMNEFAIPLLTQDITLSTNIIGYWTVLGIAKPTGSTTAIENFMEVNTGLYQFYINNRAGVDVCAIQVTLISSPAITAMNPEEEFILDDTTFGYFNISSGINWITAQLNCINWGGNLATIKSAEEDSLLFYSSTDINTYFSCWIGLNDIENDAGTDANAFVWVDGSSSTYRNFGTLGQSYPVATATSDCVRNRYKSTGELSTGWANQACSDTTNCYFCSKQVNSQGCDLIYNGFCYRVFEVSDAINWLDAQSSCAIWGGDLTSITTERDNTYLYTIIPDTVSNCWIGLNARDNNDGTYIWIDDLVSTYTNWLSSPPNAGNEDCVEITSAGGGSWETVDCETTINAFLCKRNSSVAIVGGFGQLTNGRLDFVTISENTFLFTPHTLAYGGEENIAITWLFSENSDLSSSQPETPTYENMEAGWSWLAVDITKQGYYQCEVNSLTYTIGLYDPSLTTGK